MNIKKKHFNNNQKIAPDIRNSFINDKIFHIRYQKFLNNDKYEINQRFANDWRFTSDIRDS